MAEDPRIERRIIIGMIVSTTYLQGVRPVWDSKLLKSTLARRIAKWCIEYFDKHKKAPHRDIETIFYSKLKDEKIAPELAEEIEEDLLPGLSDEYEHSEQFNADYLLEKSKEYFKERHLEEHYKKIEDSLQQGELLEAEKLANSYKPLADNVGKDIDMSSPSVLEKIEHAFTKASEPVVKFPGALGELWNHELIRGGFVSLMASEKRGKSFWLLEFADRGVKQGLNVAFIQAGDMTEAQQLRRICCKHTRKPLRELKPHKRFIPTKDCIHNQTDDCDEEVRECDHGIFNDKEFGEKSKLRRQVTMGMLQDKYKECPDYVPCYNCKDYRAMHWGMPWIKPMKDASVMDLKEAKKAIEKHFIKKKRRLKIATYPNSTLTVKEIRGLLDVWERQESFVPDLIIIDYADLLIAPEVKDFRHRQDAIWRELRGVSQEKHCLLVTATQADAKSYEQNRLKLSNFSEDKRKYAHVTAMYGLNQDPEGREKELGVMRVNELVVREAEFYANREVHVLQNLNIGQPFLTSFW